MATLEQGPCAEGLDIYIPKPGGNFRYELREIGDEEERDRTWNEVFGIYTSFRQNPFTAVHRIEKRIEVGTKVEFAINPKNNRKVGFAAYSLRRINLDGINLLVANTATKVVFGNFQNQGIGTHFAMDMIEEEEPDIVTGATASPYAYLTYLDSSYVNIGDHKEDAEYAPEVQRGIFTYLSSIDREKAAQGIPSHRAAEVTDLRYGICAGLFPADESEDFIIDPDVNPRAYEINEDWKTVGLVAARGDAKRYWLETCKETIRQRKRLMSEAT